VTGSSQQFSRLDPRLQQWIWQQGWEQLRPVQNAAIDPILRGADVVIAAPTAGGKTEAAMLPVLTRAAALPRAAGALVICISPLKALINDQATRLESMAGNLDMPVQPWHGDVPEAKKRGWRSQPGGVLLITPESLEAMFVLRGRDLPAWFANVSSIVIDEIHAFMGTERGMQVASLLHRLEYVCTRRIQRIGLSATIGDLDLAASYLRPSTDRDVVLIDSPGRGDLKLRVHGYEVASMARDDGESEAQATNASIASDIYRVTRGSDNLVFANRRIDVEEYADRLRRICEGSGLANQFYPHHGNLAASFRHDVEDALKDRTRPATAICTSTLELGIDVGSVNSIGQIGPPFSVAALRQRLGRSGRRGGSAQLRVYVKEPHVDPRTPLHDALRADLFQSVAMIELLAEGWCEPPSAGELHLSTLVQQTLSTIAQYAGIDARSLWSALCAPGAAFELPPSRFATMLKGLSAAEAVEQMEDGTILLGREGERRVEHHSFYAAFTTPDEYRLLHEGQQLGTMPIDSAIWVGMLIVFAGRRWRIQDIDHTNRVIVVSAAKGGQPPRFRGSGGNVHREVRRKMLALYSDANTHAPGYLDQTSVRLFSEGRDEFRHARLQKRRLVDVDGGALLFPWCGDREQRTLTFILKHHGIEASDDGIAIMILGLASDDCRRALEEIAEAPPLDPIALAESIDPEPTQKHHDLLERSLLVEDYAAARLDVTGAMHALRFLLGS
jgi:ATP-dependent Lhr-like helicase